MQVMVKWGILGPGKIAHAFAEDLVRTQGAVLAAVASRDYQKALDFGARYHLTRCYGSYDALAFDSEVDVVYIATPHAFHKAHTLMCLQAGKAVLCEKPMGLGREEAEDMIQMAATKKVFLMEAMWTRFIPATKELLSLIARKEIGEITRISADFGFKTNYLPESRLFNKSLGGGSLLDIGIYPIYLSHLLLGKPLHCEAKARMAPTGVDNHLECTLYYPNSCRTECISSFEEDTPLEAVIEGTRGNITLHRRFHHAQKLSIWKADGETRELTREYIGNGYSFEIEEVNRCLENGWTESPAHPLQTTLDVMETIDRIKAQIGLDYT
jgi:predicted dehydrogenase